MQPLSVSFLRPLTLRCYPNLDLFLVITSYIKFTKILANRVKSILSGLVDGSQATFVPSRSIWDNVLLAQELVFQYHLHKGPPRYALKVDLAKAYDSVEWDFLMMVLQLINFPCNSIAGSTSVL